MRLQTDFIVVNGSLPQRVRINIPLFFLAVKGDFLRRQELRSLNVLTQIN
jgi:hypothetical protein